MKICLVSRYDSRGGAARAAYWLHEGLRGSGAEVKMLVGQKNRDDFTVVSPTGKLAKAFITLGPTLDGLPQLLYKKREKTAFSSGWGPDILAAQIRKIAPDIINLHWVGGGYLQIETLAKLQQPIVWTLHDMWAFTGGCHYTQACDRFLQSCGACPQLNSTQNWDLSRWIWARKARAWKNVNMTIVTPSVWLGECARASSIFQGFRVEVIPNGLELAKYQPIKRKIAKKLLGLSPDKQLVLFGAVNATSDNRKGFDLLMGGLKKLREKTTNIELVIFGASQPENVPNFGFKTHYLGKLFDDISLSLVYAAADVFVAPSLQDNLPNTVLEALACGTPCVAFKIGGMGDMIQHEFNGYLAQPFIIEDLAKGISWVLEDGARHQQLGERARLKVEQEFSQQLTARRYQSLFQELLNQ
ncbi:MAG: glycosyltransferase family 4 protein [Gomphosphaeria aponina SAG 52.96 = DSM 107014]|uniref:Glycosyltransferase family 4 protein n=1 Tax=Gomphosphaeria aponina SAG 52.96 = DSM 107014 TaxID=1521640 RepID=A0A941GNI8_9CHRO|nr:glycosyltransferase family 4 protein [Gomphosphaeria aponina SAG 52.96 = DSM 107014]